MEQKVATVSPLEVSDALDCFRHLICRSKYSYSEPLAHRKSLGRAILDLLFSQHPGRVRLAAMRADLPAFFHYWIMFSFFVGCKHAKAGLAENPLIRPRHGYLLAGRSNPMGHKAARCSARAHLSFPLARNFKSLDTTAKTRLMLNDYSIAAIARLRGLTEMEYRQVASLGRLTGLDAILASNPDTPAALLSREVRRDGTYWDRATLVSNPSLPIDDIVWARNHWAEAAWVPAVDEILSEDRWEDFQAWLVENNYEDLRGVPAEWALSAIS